MLGRFAPARRLIVSHAPRRIFIVINSLLAVQFIFLSVLFAQSEIKISGRVVDNVSGNAVPGATVYIDGSGRTSITDGNGEFAFGDLPSGRYMLGASRIGYRLLGQVEISTGAYPASQIVILMVESPVEVSGQSVEALEGTGRGIDHVGNQTIINFRPGELLTVDDLDDRIPEIEIVESGPGRYLRIRGADLNGTLIMLDGRILNSSLTARGDISVIPIGSVSRVEITKGGDYKTRGLAGTVNFITGVDGDRRISAGAGRGDFGYEDYSIRSRGYLSKKAEYSFEGDNGFYRGNFEYIDPRDSPRVRENNFSRDNRLFWSVKRSWDRLIINLNGRYFHRQAGVPGPIFQLTPEANSEIEEREIYSSISKRFGSGMSISFSSGIIRRRADYDSPRTPSNFIQYRTRFDERSGDVKARIQRTGRIDLDGFIWSRYESLDGVDFIRPGSSFGFHSRKINTAGIGAVYCLPGIWLIAESSALTAGIRSDGGAGGDFLAPSATLRVNLDLPADPGFDISFFRSRRLPDMTDLFWKEDVFATPNPDLMAEESEGYDIGLDIRSARFSPFDFRVSKYRNIYENLIIWRKWAGDKFKPVNLSGARIDGWEASIRIKPFDGPAVFHWTGSFVAPRNRETEINHRDKFLTYRPIGQQTAEIELAYRQISFKAIGRHVGRRYITEENTKSLPPVDLLDLRIKYSRSAGRYKVGLGADVLNIGDIQYEILERQPERPREFRFTMEIERNGGLF